MTRATTPAQDAALDRRITQPIYLVEVLIEGQEYLSTLGERVVDGITYSSGVNLRSINNWSSALVTLPPTPARMAQFVSQSWRYGRCRISLLPATHYPLLIQPGYVADGYFLQGDVYGEPMLLIDGELTSAAMSGEGHIEFTVANRIAVGRWLPAARIAPPICNHLPKPGTVVVWEGDRYTLEAR
jgi:hypothetical protein